MSLRTNSDLDRQLQPIAALPEVAACRLGDDQQQVTVELHLELLPDAPLQQFIDRLLHVVGSLTTSRGVIVRPAVADKLRRIHQHVQAVNEADRLTRRHRQRLAPTGGCRAGKRDA